MTAAHCSPSHHAIPCHPTPQDVLWDRLAGVCDALHRAALEVWHLQRVLAKKRDPLTHVLLLDVVAPPEGEAGAEGGELPLDSFW